MSTIRETGETHPAPVGEYEGETRASLLKALLAKHEDQPVEPRWRQLLQRFGVTLALAGALGLAPAEAARILINDRSDRNIANRPEPGPGPLVVIIGGTPGSLSWLPAGRPLTSFPNVIRFGQPPGRTRDDEPRIPRRSPRRP